MRLCRIELSLSIEQKCQVCLDVCNFFRRVNGHRSFERLLITGPRFLQVAEHVIGLTGVPQPGNLQARGSYFIRFLFCLLEIGESLLKIAQAKIGESKISQGHFKDHPRLDRPGRSRSSTQKVQGFVVVPHFDGDQAKIQEIGCLKV